MSARALLLALALPLAACGGDPGEDAQPSDGSATDQPGEGNDGGSDVGRDYDGQVPSEPADAAAPDGGPPAVPVPRPKETESFGWKDCADTMQCGSIRVPIDYEHPDDGTLKVAVMRHLATGTRAGALFMNPGGPGASAIDFLGYYVQQQAKSPLLQRFDLVVFDPRGIGYSTSLICHSTLQKLVSADPSPDSEEEWQALDALYAGFAAECGKADNANLLPFLGTANVARDMDRVRAALGEPKTNYLGFSYGTSIGAWYAELFPDQVGRMVLDGAVDLGLSAFDHTLSQAKGFELALGRYYEWCKVSQDLRCPWTKGAEPAQAFAALQAAVELASIPAPGSDRPLGPGDFMQAVAFTMYGGTDGWRALSPALSSALAGDATTLMTFVDGYLERNPDGSYPNFQEMFNAVGCTEQYAPTVAEVRAAEPQFKREAPTFAGLSLSSMLACSHWPIQGRNVAPPTGKGAPPILVIGTTNDPATPYAWAQAFATDLVSSVLLTANLDGHTGYERGDKCIDDGVHAFLFDAIVPADTCAGAVTKARAIPRTTFDSTWIKQRR